MKHFPISARWIAFLAALASSSAFAADEICQRCHNPPLSQTEHASNGPACTGCHGPSSSHLSSPLKNPPDENFAGTNSEQLGERCLTCHEGSRMFHWQASPHDIAGISCNQCHGAHKPKTDTQVQCLSCHQDVKAELHLPSRHPILEEKVTCTDCHNPHGSMNQSLLPGILQTDICISCHQEHRGPLLFEHEPVTEDCGLCHEPHGSVVSALLKSRPPFLCQQCHLAADHSSELNDGNSLAARSANTSGASCLNCHSQVHGSNHPSGSRLTR